MFASVETPKEVMINTQVSSPGLEKIVCAFQIIRTRLPPGPTLVTHDDHARFRPVMPQVHEVVTRFYERACVLESQRF